jgi:hypothetical protein
MGRRKFVTSTSSGASVLIISIEAEQAARLIMSTAAQHRRLESLLAATSMPRGRLRVLPTSSSSRQVRAQATLLRLVSITEAHIVGELVKRIEPHAPPPRTSILDDIYNAAEDQAISSWPKIAESYKRWIHINLNKYPDWKKIEAALDARNAIAHGVGQLTRRQSRKNQSELEASLKSININVRGARLDISEIAIKEMAAVCRRFIIWLDQQLSTI